MRVGENRSRIISTTQNDVLTYSSPSPYADFVSVLVLLHDVFSGHHAFTLCFEVIKEKQNYGSLQVSLLPERTKLVCDR